MFISVLRSPTVLRPSFATTVYLDTHIRQRYRSLPVDSELAACYAWEAKAHTEREKHDLKLRQQRAKLKLLGAGQQWKGSVRVHEKAEDPWEARCGGGGSWRDAFDFFLV